MYSAFGVEHGDISKGLNPLKPAKAGMNVVHNGIPKDPHPFKSLKDDLRFVTIGPKKKKAL